ncbi:MAG: hypothetical protein ACXVRH_14695, partial [Thermoleophilaceae bacterium]
MRSRELRIFEAFCEALMPAGAGLPSAGEVGVARPVAGFLRRGPRQVRLLTGAGLALLELSSFPRRFSRMDVEARARHLERLEGSPVSALRDL